VFSNAVFQKSTKKHGSMPNKRKRFSERRLHCFCNLFGLKTQTIIEDFWENGKFYFGDEGRRTIDERNW
jgi:hypothetical protein